MGIIGRLIIGGLGVALGFYMVTKTEWWLNTFGRIHWAEKHLTTSGGSRIMYKIIGIIFILLSFTYITGLWGPFIRWVLSPLLRHF